MVDALPTVEIAQVAAEGPVGDIDGADRDTVMARLSAELRSKINSRSAGQDRSKGLRHIELSMAEAGATVAEIVAVLEPTPWNKFSDRDKLIKDVQRAWGEVKERGSEPHKGTRPPASDLLAGLKSGIALAGQRFDPLRWQVPSLLPEGAGLFIGAPKLGKSWVSFDLALAVANGTTALGCLDVDGARPVLLLALEDGERRMQDRARKMGHRLPRGLSYRTMLDQPEDAEPLVGAWLGLHGHAGPLVVIDTLAAASGAQNGRDVYAQDYRRLAAYRDLAKGYPGATVLVVHHTRKPPKEGESDWLLATLGTQGLNGAVDFVMGLDAKRGETEGWLRATGRDTPDYELALTRDLSVGPWRLDGDSFEEAADRARERHAEAKQKANDRKLSDTTNDLLAFIEEQGEVDASAVAAKFGTTVQDASSRLGRLARDPIRPVQRRGRGRYVWAGGE
ncbi:AAA family ATPase [Microlunatus sp. Y2014]|uniref:AAA family ATPase n=1 Tax=Microlunatus sp. Y2014 TaxID=3418488 RepID=UPI003DA6EB66